MLKYNVFFTQVKGLSMSVFFREKVCVLITPENHARFYLRAPFVFSLKFFFVYIASKSIM